MRFSEGSLAHLIFIIGWTFVLGSTVLLFVLGVLDMEEDLWVLISVVVLMVLVGTAKVPT